MKRDTYDKVVKIVDDIVKKKVSKNDNLILSNMFYVCREMGWDYWTYQSQPKPFLEVIEKTLTKEYRKK